MLSAFCMHCYQRFGNIYQIMEFHTRVKINDFTPFKTDSYSAANVLRRGFVILWSSNYRTAKDTTSTFRYLRAFCVEFDGHSFAGNVNACWPAAGFERPRGFYSTFLPFFSFALLSAPYLYRLNNEAVCRERSVVAKVARLLRSRVWPGLGRWPVPWPPPPESGTGTWTQCKILAAITGTGPRSKPRIPGPRPPNPDTKLFAEAKARSQKYKCKSSQDSR